VFLHDENSMGDSERSEGHSIGVCRNDKLPQCLCETTLLPCFAHFVPGVRLARTRRHMDCLAIRCSTSLGSMTVANDHLAR
jgi:hypothetical protein